jgi:hypothetical protein
VCKLISLIFIFTPFISSSQNDLEKANLKGNVESVRTRKYLFNGEKFFFRNSQNEQIIYSNEGKDSILYSFSTSNTKGKVADSTVYNYSDGKKIETLTYGWGSLRSYASFNYQDGQLNEISFFKADSTCFLILNYEHSSTGEYTVSTHTPEDTTTQKNIYYNSLGDILKEEQFKNGKLDFRKSYTYDDSRLLVKYHHKSHNPKNGDDWTKNFKYTFDKNGNWISRMEYDGNNLQGKLTRKIEYYE